MMKIPALFLLLLLMTACAPGGGALIPTDTPSPTSTLTPTVEWFPPTNTPTPLPTVIFTPTPEPRPGLGAVLVEDDFSSGEAWSQGVSDQGSVTVNDGQLGLVINAPDVYLFSTRQEPVLGDFYAEITAEPSLCTGGDEYGLMVRVEPSLKHYRLSLSCDGRARLLRVAENKVLSEVPWTETGAVPSSAPSLSRLAVWARGSELRFFIDDHLLFRLEGATIFEGTFGVFAHAKGDSPVTVNFSDLIVRQMVAE